MRVGFHGGGVGESGLYIPITRGEKLRTPCGTQPPRWPGMISTHQYSNSVPSHNEPNLVYVTNSLTQMWY